jgi:hypothetical protein
VASGTVPEPDPRFEAVAGKYFMARQRAVALTSRFADDTVRLMAEDALHNISQYQANYGDKEKPFGLDRWTWANESNDTVIKALGELIRHSGPADGPIYATRDARDPRGAGQSSGRGRRRRRDRGGPGCRHRLDTE